ncbi:MAG TPA: peptide-methionine (S)-S-oxide reductase MsrA [Longimicrobiales bacterium]|nr:peptide-methionine (S)-S-oxide reductase MsrA [Longimicrobiales bacterium]
MKDDSNGGDMAEDASAGGDTAILAGGCFWCLEAAFAELRGVASVESGYMGGHVDRPAYQQVCAGTTGHTEVVRVTFDPDTITFRDLLDVFFTMHDPTTPDRQGADVGTQYRSAIFHLTPGQKEIAESTIRELEADGVWSGIVTEITPAGTFWPAESYHRDYYRNNPDQAYCRVVIAPKVAKLRQHHLEKLRAG